MIEMRNRLWGLRTLSINDLTQLGIVNLHHITPKLIHSPEAKHQAETLEGVITEMAARIQDLELQAERGLPNRGSWPPRK